MVVFHPGAPDHLDTYMRAGKENVKYTTIGFCVKRHVEIGEKIS
jgi:hypothetical protein